MSFSASISAVPRDRAVETIETCPTSPDELDERHQELLEAGRKAAIAAVETDAVASGSEWLSVSISGHVGPGGPNLPGGTTTLSIMLGKAAAQEPVPPADPEPEAEEA